jgi:hypothetical protein
VAKFAKISGALKKRATQIELPLMDVDGTMTDGGVTLLSQTEEVALEIKTFDADDGQGLNSLTLAGTDSTTITFQGTDTYVGRAITDTLTSKTFDTPGTGNVFKINVTGIAAVTGTGAVAIADSRVHTINIQLNSINTANLNTYSDTVVGVPGVERLNHYFRRPKYALNLNKYGGQHADSSLNSNERHQFRNDCCSAF